MLSAARQGVRCCLFHVCIKSGGILRPRGYLGHAGGPPWRREEILGDFWKVFSRPLEIIGHPVGCKGNTLPLFLGPAGTFCSTGTASEAPRGAHPRFACPGEGNVSTFLGVKVENT